MILTSIHLKNFRIHNNTSLTFSDNLNYILGGNGQGKTSLLESIYYMCTTKSHITKSDNEVVRFNRDEFEIDGSFTNSSKNNVRVYYSLNENKKYYFLDQKQIQRSSDIIGKFPVVILSPADHSITQGAPSDRRKFVDSVISQASETYLKNLIDYKRTLRQRASLLLQLRDNGRQQSDDLEAWTTRLIESGVEIIKSRKKFSDIYSEYVRNSYGVIMGNSEIPRVRYSYLSNYSGDDIKDYFKELLREKRSDELRRASNLVGPHKDDFIFEINKTNLRTYGSQGQHKTFQAVLRFAEFFYIKEVTGRTPIFLLDDVFGELDSQRASRISNYLTELGQAFVTLTDLADFSFLRKEPTDKIIVIKNGAAEYA